MEQPQVLIVDGSLNGLTTASLLAQQGVQCTLVERHADTTVQYKFAGISPRSMEIYRSLGLESEITSSRFCVHMPPHMAPTFASLPSSSSSSRTRAKGEHVFVI